MTTTLVMEIAIGVLAILLLPVAVDVFIYLKDKIKGKL